MSDGTLGVPSEWLVPFLLLGLWERDSYGSELARKMDGMGLEMASPQEVYLALRRMEEDGMVVSEHDSKLSRRRYGITESGEACLEFWADSLARYQEDADLFFETYAEGTARDGHG